MSHFRIRILFVLAFFLGMTGAFQLSAENSSGGEEISIKDVYVYAGGSLGSWSGWPGGIELHGGKQSSFLVKLFTGAYVNPYFFVGVYGNLSPGVIYGNHIGSPAFVSEMGSVFAPRFFISDKMSFVIGLEIGYRYQIADVTNILVEGLGVNACIQIEYLLSEKLVLFLNPGFLAQPWGTDSETNSWYEGYPPMFYLNVGAAYVILTR